MSFLSISVQNLMEEHPELELNLLAGTKGLKKKISNSDINRPGLSLTGFFDFFAHDRIQVFGKGEWAYLNTLSEETVRSIGEKFFSYPLNCIIFTHGNHPSTVFLELAEKHETPVFVSSLTTHKLITILSDILNKSLAPRAMRHGVLIEVFGVGILLSGKSGVGKSETALELIERGHRLIADDMVEIRRYSESYLVGSSSDLLRHKMEIRGLGIINIKDIFGIGSVRDNMLIELIINIEEFNPEVYYDRTGLEEEFEIILNIKVPLIRIPVKPGRNIPILVETAAMNQRLKNMGIHGAKEFSERLNALMKFGKEL